MGHYIYKEWRSEETALGVPPTMPPTIGEAPDQCKNKGTAFPMQISNHVGRVEISEIMRTHQGFVENAKPGVDTMLDFKSVSYQQSRRRNPDWRPSLWNQFVREESDKTFIKGVKTAKSEVDCGPPKNAMKYSKWRAGYRKRMEKKGIKQTKATEIMWSFQEEDNAKHHLRRHQHVIRNTPSCVDHHPPVEAMAHRKWRRATASTHKVDAPLPRPKSARYVQWKNTFDQLNLSIKDVTKADLAKPMLDLDPLVSVESSISSFAAHNQEASGHSSSTVEVRPSVMGEHERRKSTPGLCRINTFEFPTAHPEPAGDDLCMDGLEPDPSESLPDHDSALYDANGWSSPIQSPQRSSQEPDLQRSPSGQQLDDLISQELEQQAVLNSHAQQRPQSQQSHRTQSSQRTKQLQRPKSQMSQRSEIHSGKPSQYSATLSQAYSSAASNDNVRKLLEMNKKKKSAGPGGRSRPGTAC